MKRAIASQVLIITPRDDSACLELSRLLAGEDYALTIEHDLGTAINRVQNQHYDVIVLDAKIEGMAVEKTIQIIRNIDPETKVIVKTDDNSKKLEAQIRKEKIYYYHLDSFGLDDLKLAIDSAVNKKRLVNNIHHTRHKRILIVDENDDFIEIHRTNLENHHYEVDVCYDADEAFQKIKEKPPQLILVDMDIATGSDGRHFIERIVTTEDVTPLPMLLLLSEQNEGEYHHIMDRINQTPAKWRALSKPVKIEDIIPTVNELLTD